MQHSKLTPEVGQPVYYVNGFGLLTKGYVAEVAQGPLTGADRCRVVDRPGEMRDEEAGRWVYATNLFTD